MEGSSHEVTELLLKWRNGDESALDKLIPLVYEELHRLAKRFMAHQAPGHTLQTTELVNEAYTRLLGRQQVEWQNRAHFFAVCAKIMRGILVDHYRRRRPSVLLDEAALISDEDDIDVVALDEALSRLAVLDTRKSQIVEMRYFGGMTEKEVAEVLEVAPITVKREWSRARAWLLRELSESREDDS
jgi:RNA polymerase sigma-70 factor (ECF subfamily)